MPLPAADDVVSALDHAYTDVTALVADLDDDDLLLPSGCRGWSIADLLFHMLLDAQRALVAFAMAEWLRGAARGTGVQMTAMSTKRERCSCAATVTVSVGPLRCFATMKSASPARGDSLS